MPEPTPNAATTPPNGAPPAATSAPDAEKAKKEAERKELSAAAQREDARVRRQRLEAQQRADSDAKLQRELAEYRAKAARADEIEKEIADPLAFLEKRGITSREVGERIIKRGTPDAKIAELEERIRKAEEEKARDTKAAEERAKKAEGERALARAHRELLDAVATVKAETPILSKLSEQRIVEEFLATFRLAQADPETAPYAATYTNHELLKATEARLKADREASIEDLDDELLEAALTKRKARASSVAESGQQTDATGRQGTEAASSRSKPLTHAVAQTTGGSWKPDNWASLPDREQNRILADRLRKGLPCD